MSKSIGSRIAEKRGSKGLTRPQLAKRAKVSVGYLSHIEKDHIPLTDEVAARFEKALGIRFTEAELTKHNAKSRKWLTNYRADLSKAKSRKPRVKAVASSAQPTLLGFSEMMPGFNIAERVAELVAQALIKAQQQSTETEVEVKPIFKRVK